jgi:O-antigen ligase/polysaccharide polymerase Wzy-like membrane protein
LAAAAPATTWSAPRPVQNKDAPVRPLLFFIFLTPLIPRPTAGGSMGLFAPIALAGLAAAFLFGIFVQRYLEPRHARVVGRLSAVIFVPTSVYGLRILIQSQWSESGYFAAQLAMAVGIVVILVWCCVTNLELRRAYSALVAGYLVLSVVMIYVGVTGDGIFEAARPARTYGLSLPFFKAAGIPRSYGELAIFSSAALAYILVYRTTRSGVKNIVLLAIWTMTILVAQSRTGFIAAAIVLITYVLFRLAPRRPIARGSLLAVLGIPILAQWLYPALQSESIIADVVGQSTFQNNVDTRLNIYDLAFSWLTHPTFGLIFWGTDRASWAESTHTHFGDAVVLHNHFLSTLMFFGLVGGCVVVVGLLAAPAWRLASSGLPRPEQEVVFLGVIGMYASLQFYEGFFSLIVMWQVAVLWFVAYCKRDTPEPVGPVPIPQPQFTRGGSWVSPGLRS